MAGNPKGVLNLEDKAFELLAKMYSEFSEFRKDITDKVENNSKETKTIGNQVTRLEGKLDIDAKALFDGYKQTYEKLGVLETKVDSISQKIEKQDVELKVLQGGK